MRFNWIFENIISNLGRSFIVLITAACALPRNLLQWKECVQQIYFVGVLSLFVMVVPGAFVGVVVTVQGYDVLQRFGAEAVLSQLVALSVYRELGPVLGALLFAGRAGGAISAELGLMQVTEQIPSLDMMAVNPNSFVLFPRIWATLITVPMLVGIFDFMAIMGSYAIAIYWLGVDANTYWSTLKSSVHFGSDVVHGLLKSFLFGFLVAWIAIYQGVFASRTASGVAYAATKTVVYSSLAILGVDVLVTIAWMGR